MFQETLFNVWQAISELQDDVTSQRIGLQQLKLEIKLNSLLNDQVDSLSLSVLYTDFAFIRLRNADCINMCTDG